jgi:hypothetical protein
MPIEAKISLQLGDRANFAGSQLEGPEFFSSLLERNGISVLSASIKPLSSEHLEATMTHCTRS